MVCGQPWKDIMFARKEQVEFKTLIAQGTRIEGGMKFEQGLRVDGEVDGAIQGVSEGSLLVISEGAVARGGLTADRVIINGTVQGTVHAREMQLQPSARIEGDVHYATLEMHEGAIISGKLRPLTAGTASEGSQPIRLSGAGA